MDLKSFVAETLTSIVDGVREAQCKAKDSGARIVPNVFAEVQQMNPEEAGRKQIQDVEFDVAITVNEEARSGAKIGVFGGFFKGGVEGASGNVSGSISRIRFGVPIKLPIQNSD